MREIPWNVGDIVVNHSGELGTVDSIQWFWDYYIWIKTPWGGSGSTYDGLKGEWKKCSK